MSTTDELWAWIYPTLQELTAERAGNPDKSWGDLRAYFVERAGLSHHSDNPLVDDMIKQLDELPDGDREALLDDGNRLETFVYEVVARHGDSAQTDGGDTPTYDEGAWQQFLVQNGAAWTGDEVSWPQFREWFLYHANENDLGQPATSLLNYLDGQSAPERVATLAQYGVTIQGAPEPAAESSDAAEIRALLAEDPEFAELPAESQRELIEKVKVALAG